MATGITQGLNVHRIQDIHNLQAQANRRYITQSIGNNALKINWVSDGSMFAETAISGLTIGDEYLVLIRVIEIVSTKFRIKINSQPNNNASNVAEIGYGLGARELRFTATATTMYLAIGDESGESIMYSIIDNTSINILGVEGITNTDFEVDTSGWYAQNSNALLTTYVYTEQLPSTNNPYLKTVTIPPYDSTNATHMLLTPATWNETNLNTAGVYYFYLEPGVYAGRPNLTTSGTISQRRYITINDANSGVHPAAVASANRAMIAVKFLSSYWTVSRVAGTANEAFMINGEKGSFCFNDGGTNACDSNIVDQCYEENGFVFASLQHNANNCTIQKCYWNGSHSNFFTYDDAYIMLGATWSPSNINTMNFHLLDNDAKNYKLIKLHDDDGTPTNIRNFEGYIAYGNNNWYDADVYCDSDGTPNPNGIYSFAETGWGGIKQGSTNPANRILLEDNWLSGSKPTYPSAPAYLSSPYPGFTLVYLGSKYVDLVKNFIYDCPSGLGITSNTGSLEAEDITATGNIIVGCGGSPTNATSMRLQACKNVTMDNNLVKDAVYDASVVQYAGTYGGNSFSNNTIINQDLPLNWDGSQCAGLTGGDTTVYLTSSQGATNYPYDYTRTLSRYSGSPFTIVLQNVLTLPQV